MKISLLGAPGSGKGTQAKLLSEYYDIAHISTGDLFRRAISQNTPLGQKIKKYMSTLVPDEIVIALVMERISQDDCKNGFILDGFPRTLPQAKCLDQICQELNIKIDYVIDIEVDSQELISRLSGRRVCKNCGSSYHVMFNKPKQENVCDRCNGPLYTRQDDSIESVTVRLQNYENQTKPLIDYYNEKGLLVEINGQQNIDDVFKEIVLKLGE